MKKLPNNKYDFIANMFTNDDEIRPALLTPGVIENNIYATDAHTCIRFSEKLANNSYLENTNFPNAKAIFDNLKLQNKTVLKVEDLMLKIYDCQAFFENKTEDCQNCHGDGVCDCKCCENETTCKKCNGKGIVNLDTPYAGITITGSDILFLEKRIMPKFIYKIINVALILNQTKITVKHDPNNLQLVFIIADVEILVMSKSIIKP